MINDAIGGYFELELSREQEFHSNAICLNTGRNAFEYILRVRKYTKIYMPFYTCDVLMEPLRKLKIPVEFYQINEFFEPIFNFNLIGEREGFLYTNYFGLKNDFIQEYKNIIPNLILDYAQAFYSQASEGLDTFYSARKFFGVSDGAYLYIDKQLDLDLEQDSSYERMSHLLIRTDKSAEEGYKDFGLNEKSLMNRPIKWMSKLTRKLLSSIDYEQIKLQRIQNFLFLHDQLKSQNQFKIEELDGVVPMVYPFWPQDLNFKSRLFENKIYCPTFWPNVLNWCEKEDFEFQVTNEFIFLPIDQRYDIENMIKITNLL